LILDLLERLAIRERAYEEVIDIGRTLCPRLPVWEGAKDRVFVAGEHFNGREVVRITSWGSIFLHKRKTSQRPGAGRPV
jgi:hypothetical protein